MHPRLEGVLDDAPPTRCGGASWGYLWTREQQNAGSRAPLFLLLLHSCIPLYTFFTLFRFNIVPFFIHFSLHPLLASLFDSVSGIHGPFVLDKIGSVEETAVSIFVFFSRSLSLSSCPFFILGRYPGVELVCFLGSGFVFHMGPFFFHPLFFFLF